MCGSPVPITFSQAVLGDTVQVPSIDGKVEYTVPEGTQSGTTFRLRGKGIQYLKAAAAVICTSSARWRSPRS